MTSPTPRPSIQRFIAELKRRQVFQVAVGYGVVGFGFLEGYQLLEPALGFPDAVYPVLAALVIVGFPVSVVLSWVYNWTPGGLTRTEPLADPRASTVGSVGEEVHEPPARGSIAVLPFSDMSPDGDQEYFGQGIAEEIIHSLARVDGLQVAARTSSFAFGAAPQDVRSIGRHLGVASVLEGSVRKAGTRVRITTQLIEVTTGYHLWSETYERELADIFAIQDEITEAVVTTVAPKLRATDGEPAPDPVQVGHASGTGGTSKHAPEPEAYELYLKGRHSWYRRFQVGLQTSVRYFEASIEKDPKYAPPYAGVADALHSLAIFGFVPPAPARAKAAAFVERALSLDPNLARAHFSNGSGLTFFEQDYRAAEVALERAVQLDPTYAEAAAWAAFPLVLRGDVEAGLAQADAARALDPDSPYVGSLAAVAYAMTSHREEAARLMEWVLGHEPGLSTARVVLGMLLTSDGRVDQAITHLEQGVALTNRAFAWLAALGVAYRRAGRDREVAEIRAEIERRRGEEYVAPVAEAVFALDHSEVALAALEEAAEERSPLLTLSALLPVFDPLRDEPRFAAVLERLGIHAPDPRVPGTGEVREIPAL